MRAGPTAARAQINAFNFALECHWFDNGMYPATLDELVMNESGKNYLNDVATIPKDPWGNPYRYTAPGANGNECRIVSYGSDGKLGGSGEAADITSWDMQQ